MGERRSNLKIEERVFHFQRFVRSTGCGSQRLQSIGFQMSTIGILVA